MRFKQFVQSLVLVLCLCVITISSVSAKKSKEYKYKKCRNECLETYEKCDERAKRYRDRDKRDKKWTECHSKKEECLNKCY